MPLELFTNNASTTVSSGGTTAPAQGTTETWTVASSASFPAASNAANPPTYFYVFDPVAQTEVIQVTNVSGTTWSVTRGASGTTPVAHTTGFTVYTDISAATLQNFKQTPGAATTAVTIANTATETVVATYQPTTDQLVPGASWEAIAFGTMGWGGAARPVQTWRLRWGGVAGTQLAILALGTNAPVVTVTTAATGASFDVNGTVSMIDATHAVANLNWWYNGAALTAAASNAVTSAAASGSAAAPILISGSGPLVLTFQWGTAATYNTITSSAPLIYRAA